MAGRVPEAAAGGVRLRSSVCSWALVRALTVCVRRESERAKVSERASESEVCVCACVRVKCARMREREGEGERARARARVRARARAAERVSE